MRKVLNITSKNYVLHSFNKHDYFVKEEAKSNAPLGVEVPQAQ